MSVTQGTARESRQDPTEVEVAHVALVSACLLGRACRYDGASKPHAAVAAWQQAREAAGATVVPVCPEELGELGTPRPAADLRGGDGAAVWRGEALVRRVHDDGDVTAAFRRGAERAYALAPTAREAVLKARSPSCGVGSCHQDGRVQPGDGVFAALLRAAGVGLATELQLATGVGENAPPATGDAG